MKKFCCIILVALLLMPAASAAEMEREQVISDWAVESVERAYALGISGDLFTYDLREPIERGSFAEKATGLVAIEFGSNLTSYVFITNYRNEAAKSEAEPYDPFAQLTALQVSKDLGILQGRGDGDDDIYSHITRQEAAVMLARTYRAYAGDDDPVFPPVYFDDRDDIADWAMDDIQLMNHLGIMTGTGWERFDPLGSYTIEQCLVTLLRLHENAPYDGVVTENPFAISPPENGFSKIFEKSDLRFAFETDNYYICAYHYVTQNPMGNYYVYIDIVDRDMSYRSYPTEILRGSSSRGRVHVEPEDPFITADGACLTYTAVLPVDAYDYYYDENIEPQEKLLFVKGIYTVTMDLATGEQTWTREDLPEGRVEE